MPTPNERDQQVYKDTLSKEYSGPDRCGSAIAAYREEIESRVRAECAERAVAYVRTPWEGEASGKSVEEGLRSAILDGQGDRVGKLTLTMIDGKPTRNVIQLVEALEAIAEGTQPADLVARWALDEWGKAWR